MPSGLRDYMPLPGSDQPGKNWQLNAAPGNRMHSQAAWRQPSSESGSSSIQGWSQDGGHGDGRWVLPVPSTDSTEAGGGEREGWSKADLKRSRQTTQAEVI